MHDEVYAEDPRMQGTFTSSRHCLVKFMVRNNGLSLHRRTTVGQHDPAQLIIDRFRMFCMYVIC